MVSPGIIQRDIEKIQLRVSDPQRQADAQKSLTDFYDLIETKAGGILDDFRSRSQILELALADALQDSNLKEEELYVLQFARGTYRCMLAEPPPEKGE